LSYGKGPHHHSSCHQQHLCKHISEQHHHCHQLRFHQLLDEGLRHQLQLCRLHLALVLARGFTNDFVVIDNDFATISARDIATDYNDIDYALTNISVSGFANDLSVINNAFINISARGPIGTFDFTFANILERSRHLHLQLRLRGWRGVLWTSNLSEDKSFATHE
jgi:hypothetical protein